MANLHASKKDIRKTVRRTVTNKKLLVKLDKSLKLAKKKTEGAIDNLYSVLDKMVKKNIINKNKASRIKSRTVKKTK